jgi:ATP-dependent RNA helicase RhlE
MPFSSLGLPEKLVNALRHNYFLEPYPIQSAVIPSVLEGKDVLGIAQTGSGKTASYVLPVLTLMQSKSPVRDRRLNALVLVPTRELAIQVEKVFSLFGPSLPNKVKSMAVYGGVSINPQMIALLGVNILVATPGRLLDLVKSKAVHIGSIDTLVLDEADKMLNLGFKDEMAAIFKLLPAKRQNLLFSATLSKDLESMNQILLNDPVVVEIEGKTVDFDKIEQIAYAVTEERRGPFLRYLIKHHDMQQVLIFTSSVRKADGVALKLNNNGIQAVATHSKKNHHARTEALRKFKEGELQVLVATDLLSRGIDIVELPVVINYELPRSPKDYVHRIGRTGRAEANGKAFTLLLPEDAHHFQVIQKKMKHQVEILPSDDIDLHGF